MIKYFLSDDTFIGNLQNGKKHGDCLHIFNQTYMVMKTVYNLGEIDASTIYLITEDGKIFADNIVIIIITIYFIVV